MITAAHAIYDHTAIRRWDRRFTPQMALHEHRLARNWLTGQLAEGFDGPTVVMR